MRSRDCRRTAATAQSTRDLFARLARERATVSEALSASAGLSAG
jgi:hypothetical protein